MSTQLHPYWFIVAAFGLSMVPIFFSLTTSYVKVSIVFGMLRSALGTQQTPSAMVVMALSIAVSMFIMQPVIGATYAELERLNFAKIVASKPTSSDLTTFAPVIQPWREFLTRHTGAKERALLQQLDQERSRTEISPAPGAEGVSAIPAASTGAEIPLTVLLPAFLLTELRQAFTMGFTVLLPFLVIDLVVGNILAGMGMMMMSPALVALPLKLLIFVLADGWLLIVRGLVLSYEGGP